MSHNMSFTFLKNANEQSIILNKLTMDKNKQEIQDNIKKQLLQSVELENIITEEVCIQLEKYKNILKMEITEEMERYKITLKKELIEELKNKENWIVL